MTTTIGSYFMTLSSGETAATAYYPTDGMGALGTGSLSTASHLKDVVEWVLDGIQILTVGAATRTITLKDSSGTTLTSWDVPTTAAPGDIIKSGIQFGGDPGNAGFTIEVDNIDCLFSVLYRIVRYDPTPS